MNTHTHTHTCTHTNTNKHTHTHTHTQSNTHIIMPCEQLTYHTHAHTHTCTHTCTHTHSHIHTHMHTHKHTHTYKHAHTQTHTHTHSDTHIIMPCEQLTYQCGVKQTSQCQLTVHCQQPLQVHYPGKTLLISHPIAAGFHQPITDKVSLASDASSCSSDSHPHSSCALIS